MSYSSGSFDCDFTERSLEGRVVLVARGTGGLSSTAVALQARDGATVVVGYRNDRTRAAALKQALEARYRTVIHQRRGLEDKRSL